MTIEVLGTVRAIVVCGNVRSVAWLECDDGGSAICNLENMSKILQSIK